MIVDVSNHLIDALNVIVVSNVFHIELLIYEGKDKAVLHKRLFLSCLFSKNANKKSLCGIYSTQGFYFLISTFANSLIFSFANFLSPIKKFFEVVITAMRFVPRKGIIYSVMVIFKCRSKN